MQTYTPFYSLIGNALICISRLITIHAWSPRLQINISFNTLIEFIFNESLWIILNRLICNVNAHLWLFNRRTSVRMISFCCTFWVCAFFFSFLFCFVCEITLKKCSEKHFVSWQIIPSMNIMKWIFWCQKLHSQSLPFLALCVWLSLISVLLEITWVYVEKYN